MAGIAPKPRPRPGQRPGQKAGQKGPSKGKQLLIVKGSEEAVKKGIDYKVWGIIGAVCLVILLVSTYGGKETPAPTPPTQAARQSQPENQPIAAAQQGTEPQAAETISAVPSEAGSTQSQISVPGAPPEVTSIEIEPPKVYVGTVVKASVGGKNGADMTFVYEWMDRNTVVSTTPELDTSRLKKGALLTLCVTPVVSGVKGRTIRSPIVEILNTPPEITSIPSGPSPGVRYRYEVKAKDVDEDTLTYSLEEGPLGMTINKETGVLEWDPPKGMFDFPVNIVVNDGTDSGYQKFNLSFKR